MASATLADGSDLTSGNTIYEAAGVSYAVITVSEPMYDNATSTGNAVTNPANYILYDASGNVISGAISKVYYGLDESADLYAMYEADPTTYASFSSLSSRALGSNKYEIVIAFTGLKGGSLTTGDYTLELVAATSTTNGLRDANGNAMGRTGFVTSANYTTPSSR